MENPDLPQSDYNLQNEDYMQNAYRGYSAWQLLKQSLQTLFWNFGASLLGSLIVWAINLGASFIAAFIFFSVYVNNKIATLQYPGYAGSTPTPTMGDIFVNFLSPFILMSFVIVLFLLPLYYGMCFFMLDLRRGLRTSISRIFAGYKHLRAMLLGGILLTILSIVPAAILISIVAFYENAIAVWLQVVIALLILSFFLYYFTILIFWPFFIVEMDISAFAALLASWEFTQGKRGKLFLLVAVYLGGILLLFSAILIPLAFVPGISVVAQIVFNLFLIAFSSSVLASFYDDAIRDPKLATKSWFKPRQQLRYILETPRMATPIFAEQSFSPTQFSPYHTHAQNNDAYQPPYQALQNSTVQASSELAENFAEENKFAEEKFNEEKSAKPDTNAKNRGEQKHTDL